jgi:transposase
MSLRPEPIEPVPEETARVAGAAVPRGNAWLRLRDELGTIYTDETCAALFPTHGRPAEVPWRLALVTVLQFAEGLSDRQAAEAVRARLDWQYLLGLALDDLGFDFSVLSEFRTRLIAGGTEQQWLDALLALCAQRGWLQARGPQRTDSTHVLAKVRALNRIETVAETLRATLDALAAAAPNWLRAQVDAERFERYRSRIEASRLPQRADGPRAVRRTGGCGWTPSIGGGVRLDRPTLAPRNPGCRNPAACLGPAVRDDGGPGPLARRG